MVVFTDFICFVSLYYNLLFKLKQAAGKLEFSGEICYYIGNEAQSRCIGIAEQVYPVR